MTTYSPAQVYQEVLAQGGSQEQAQVAAALVDGIESNGQLNDKNPTSTASGLFQFLTTTWDSNGGSAYTATAGDASLDQQVGVFLKASAGNNFYPWAPDLGGAYTNTFAGMSAPLPGSKVANAIAKLAPSLGTTSAFGSIADNTPAQNAALAAAAAEPGGAAYLTALNAQNQANGEGAGMGVSPNAGGTTGDAVSSTQGTLADVITSVLAPYGLDTPAISNWASTVSTQYLAGGMTETQAAEQIGIDLQAPTLSDDPATQAAQLSFQNLYPGMALRAAAGLPPITVAQYQAYQDSVYQAASAVGLTPAMLNAITESGQTNPLTGGSVNAVGLMIGADISPAQVTQRLQDGYDAATQANPETLRLLQEYYPTTFPQGTNGNPASNSAVLAYYLNPENTINQLQNQMTAAQIGTEGVNSEFGGISAGQAQQLQQAGVTQSTARSTFESLSKLVPLETNLPGVASTNESISQAQLIGEGFFGANQQQLEDVESARKAPFAGGGGYATTAKGVVGAGGASTEGTQGT